MHCWQAEHSQSDAQSLAELLWSSLGGVTGEESARMRRRRCRALAILAAKILYSHLAPFVDWKPQRTRPDTTKDYNDKGQDTTLMRRRLARVDGEFLGVDGI